MRICNVYFLGIVFLLSCEIRHTDLTRAIPGHTWINPVDRMTFVWIKPGSIELLEPFRMGDSVVLNKKTVQFDSGFWMGMTEVMVGEFRKFVEETGYVTTAEKEGNLYHWKNPGFIQSEKNPVVYTSFEDALAYSEWAGVAIPTETEWLYACRAGTSNPYFWGDTLDDRYLWYRMNSPKGTQPVGMKLPNPWGLSDMMGNAWEYVWVCEDEYGIRGASWTRCDGYQTRYGTMAENLIGASVDNKLSECRAFYAQSWDDDRGFRCIKR
jgi:formylglycine-generating enzyme required for sulfatase activity